jgi:hypothetical protein
MLSEAHQCCPEGFYKGSRLVTYSLGSLEGFGDLMCQPSSFGCRRWAACECPLGVELLYSATWAARPDQPGATSC